MNDLDRKILDHKIAKKVMGEQTITISGSKGSNIYLGIRNEETTGDYTIFTPTTDANDAQLLINVMGKLGFRMELHILRNESHCQFIPDDSEKEFSNFSSSSSDSKPLTDVCLAALKAVGSLNE